MLAILAALCVTVYFSFFIAPGVGAGFMQDDLMNLYRAWTQPLPDLLLDHLIFFRFSPQYRPTGAIFYRSIFNVFGFEPLPLHVGCAVLLWLCIGVSYWFTREITGSRRVALLAALIHSFHGNFTFLIFNSGMCYDLLCFLFYFGAFAFYVRVRNREKLLNWRQTVAWCGLFILALNSKEMAVTLPVMIGVYELFRHPPESWKGPQLAGWVAGNGRIALIGGVMTAFFIGGRLRADIGLLNIGTYVPDISLSVYLNRSKHFLDGMFYSPGWLTSQVAALMLASGIVLAWWKRNTALRLSGALLMIGVLPVAFIEPRGLEAVFIPTMGAAIFVAILVQNTFDRIWRTPSVYRAVALFALTLISLSVVHFKYGYRDPEPLLAEGKNLGLVRNELRRLLPTIPRGGRILFIRDPFLEYHHGTTFMLRTMHRDPALIVDRLDQMGFPRAQPDVASYTGVVSFDGGHLRVCAGDDLGLREAQDIQEVRCTPVLP